MKTPKVIHVVLSMCVGGAERLVYDMVRDPVFAANPPTVCCMDAVGELGEKLVEEGYKVHCKGRTPGLDWSMILWLLDRIREEKAEVVHAHQYSPLFYAVPAALLAGGVKVVYTEHGRFHPDRKSWKRTLFNPLLALGVDHLVSISASTASAMAEFDNLPLGRIKVVHNGVCLSRMNPDLDVLKKRRELGIPTEAKVVGTAARLDRVKNLQMLLKVFKEVVREVPESILAIAGEGPEAVPLREFAAGLGISEQVRFLGLRFDMPEVYQVFDLFALTSLTEGISVTLLEAMASGVPAVVTDVGGNGEVVANGSSGFTVPLTRPDHFAERVVQLLKDPVLSRRVAGNAGERVRENFDFTLMVSRYRELYCC